MSHASVEIVVLESGDRPVDFPFDEDAQLQQQQFLEGDALASFLLGLQGVGQVHLPDCLPSIPAVMLIESLHSCFNALLTPFPGLPLLELYCQTNLS